MPSYSIFLNDERERQTQREKERERDLKKVYIISKIVPSI